jgi:hypothetical protein
MAHMKRRASRSVMNMTLSRARFPGRCDVCGSSPTMRRRECPSGAFRSSSSGTGTM